MVIKKNKISIITLTYNKLKEATKPFLDYLYHRGGGNFELVIVDNGSTDGTVEFLKYFEKCHDNVRVIYNSENLGYSKGCNQGIRVAQGDIIGLLNNDILFSSDWMKQIVDFLEKEPNVGFVSPTSIEAYACSEWWFNRRRKRRAKKVPYVKSIKCSFSCVFAKRRLFDEIGLFDENFTPAYFEDDDICWRAMFAGYVNYNLNDVYFYHKGSLTGKSLTSYNQIFEKNKKYFFEKYADKPYVEASWQNEVKLYVCKRKLGSRRYLSLKNLFRLS